MWRIAMILIALLTLLGSATVSVADHDHVPSGTHHASSHDVEDGSDCLSAAPDHDECLGLTCCMALHCASFATLTGATVVVEPSGAPRRQAFQDRALPQPGRVIAPPTAPPKLA